MDIKQLKKFLAEAHQKGYASGAKAKKLKEKDGSKTIVLKSGDWKCHDNYFGGEPYGGREVVFYKDKPVHMTVYYGSVDKKVSDFKKVYRFLQKALSAKDHAGKRGPKKYVAGDFVYLNNFQGTLANFSGEEVIKLKGKKIYQATYAGGLVDQRKEKNG